MIQYEVSYYYSPLNCPIHVSLTQPHMAYKGTSGSRLFKVAPNKGNRKTGGNRTQAQKAASNRRKK